MDNENEKIISWLKIASSLFLLIGITFSLGIWVDYGKIQEVQKWPVIDGHIVMHYQKSGNMGQTKQLIKYQYSVDGNNFESCKVNPNQYTPGKEDFFKVEKDNKTTVFVHYNKRNPGEAYLVVEWNPFSNTHFYYAVSSIFFATIFGIIIALAKFRKTTKNNEEQLKA